MSCGSSSHISWGGGSSSVRSDGSGSGGGGSGAGTGGGGAGGGGVGRGGGAFGAAGPDSFNWPGVTLDVGRSGQNTYSITPTAGTETSTAMSLGTTSTISGPTCRIRSGPSTTVFQATRSVAPLRQPLGARQLFSSRSLRWMRKRAFWPAAPAPGTRMRA
ncbi:hypothetical protein F1188_18415 [Roseospira marina]|uniref:Uncharacterized protein n=1 Tax=Roseospira marina TaxID=140057 RepID=A0A5M6I6M9_9PROT|nr:hypothetical protein F1188_18415 [Roseospira marina]